MAHLKITKSRLVMILLGITAISQPVFAQQEAQQDELKLEEVMVTAQKREQSLQDVPLAISALSAEDMSAAGVQDMGGIANLVAALEVQTNTSPAATNFRIRRVGNLGNIPTFEPAVGVFIDGAFRSRSVYAVSELFDLERIEILRGPQSTLYGKNTTAGVIGIYTAAPSDTLTGGFEITAGNWEGGNDAFKYLLKGGISGPLSDNVQASISGSWVDGDDIFSSGLVNNPVDMNNNERFSVRSQLQWQPSDAMNVRLTLGMVREDDQQEAEDLFYDPNGFVAGIILPTFQAFGVSDTCTDNDPHNRVGCLIKSVDTDFETTDATLLIDYDLSNGWTLNSITSWDNFRLEGALNDAMQVMAPLLIFQDTHESTSWQQELRLTSEGGETVDWLLGTFFYTNEFLRGDRGRRPSFIADTLASHPVVAAINQALLGAPIPIPVGTDGQLGYLDNVQNTDYYALFGQASWNISDTFRVTAGMRWQNEDKDAQIHQFVNDPSPSIISLLLAPPSVSTQEPLRRSTDALTWSISPQWFVTDQTMLFATLSNGFKSGGFNTGFGTLPIDAREFNDEDIMHYELGFKSELWGNRLRLAGSVFFTEYEDYQDAAFVGAQFTVGNADMAELKGVELEGSVLLSESLTADFSISYADFVYEKNFNGQCYPGRAPDSPTDPTACDLSGEHPVNAPEWKSHLGLTYERPVSWGDAYARFDWSWTDDYNTSFSSDPRLKQDAYSWVNLRAGTRWDNYEISVWVDNLLDETVVNFDAVLNVYSGDGSYQSYIQAPRSYGVTFRANF